MQKRILGMAVGLALILMAPAVLAGSQQQVTLNGPRSIVANELGSYGGTLLAPSGKPIPNHALGVYVDGTLARTVRTNTQGAYNVGLSFGAGTHEIEVGAQTASAALWVTVACASGDACIL